ncbi:hypothetical protein sos41_11810 [Alphaproteobacteria bacterium SO-S41]|nr:hypothetical protein sos41_11810 [Alphaproteobacteria bacterium SO-S41]
MPVLTQSPLIGDVVKYEDNLNYTREVVTLKSGLNYLIGTILGIVTATGKYTVSPNAETGGIEGAETAKAVLIENVDATGADKVALVLRRGPSIVADAALIYEASVNDGTKKATKRAQLVAVGIVPRTAV